MSLRAKRKPQSLCIRGIPCARCGQAHIVAVSPDGEKRENPFQPADSQAAPFPQETNRPLRNRDRSPADQESRRGPSPQQGKFSLSAPHSILIPSNPVRETSSSRNFTRRERTDVAQCIFSSVRSASRRRAWKPRVMEMPRINSSPGRWLSPGGPVSEIIKTFTWSLMSQIERRDFLELGWLDAPDFRKIARIGAIAYVVNFHRIVVVHAHEFARQDSHYPRFETGEHIAQTDNCRVMPRDVRRIFDQFPQAVAFRTAQIVALAKSLRAIKTQRQCLYYILDKDRLEFRIRGCQRQ